MNITPIIILFFGTGFGTGVIVVVETGVIVVVETGVIVVVETGVIVVVETGVIVVVETGFVIEDKLEVETGFGPGVGPGLKQRIN